jgi:hypothetical protein
MIFGWGSCRIWLHTTYEGHVTTSRRSLPLIFCIHVRSGPIYWGVIYLAKKIIRWWYFTCKKLENIICDGILHVNMFHYFKIPYFTCKFFTKFTYTEYIGPYLLSHIVLRFLPSDLPEVTTVYDFGSVLGWPLDTSFKLSQFYGDGSWLCVCEVALRATLNTSQEPSPCSLIVWVLNYHPKAIPLTWYAEICLISTSHMWTRYKLWQTLKHCL